MIPYFLQKNCDYHATIVCYQNQKEYSSLVKEVKGLEMDFLQKSGRGRQWDVVKYIMKNFRKIDVLQVYHFEIDYVDAIGLYILLRKLIGRKYVTTFKCDGSSRFSDTDFSRVRFQFWRNWVIKRINFFSIETSKDLEIAKTIDSYKSLPFVLIPNGFYDQCKRKDLRKIGKKKQILSVGRLGTNQKNTEYLLESFAQFAEKNEEWELHLVGSVENDFQEYLSIFFGKNERIRNRIIFHGVIIDKEELQGIYAESAVFILTSRNEGSPLVIPEAMSNGCYLLFSNPIHLRFDVLKGDFIGKSFSLEDTSFLVDEFMQLDQLNFDEIKIEIQNFAYQNFYWPEIVAKFNMEIEKNLI